MGKSSLSLGRITSVEKGTLEHVPVDLIKDDEFQVRGEIDDVKFRELLASIRQVGVLVPILLKEKDSHFLVIAGHRRFKAVTVAGLSEVPAYIFNSESDIGWPAVFAENMFRCDLSPVEEAAALNDCLSRPGWNLDRLSEAIGKSSDWISDRVELLTWRPALSLAVHLGKISVSAARNLAKISDLTHQNLLVDYAVDNGATARTTAAWLQAWRVGVPTDNPGEVELAEGRTALQPIVPYTPCVVCGRQYEMAKLTYAPVCSECSDVVASVAREMRKTDSPGS